MTLTRTNFTLTADQRAGEFSRLPQELTDQVDFRLECLAWVAGQGKGKVKTSIQRLADEKGGSFQNWYLLWRNFTKGTAELRAGDWRHLVDRRKVSKYWKRSKSKGLPAEFRAHWHDLARDNKRGSRAAYRDLLLQLLAWRRGDITSFIPGYDDPPPNAPGCDHPRGWSYDNLMAPHNAMTPVELVAAREGRAAAKKLVPSILTTRAHSYPLAEVQFDDVWMNFTCRHPQSREPVRLLQFHGADHFSGFLFTPATKPRLPSLSKQAMESLNEREFRLYYFNFLATVGWSRRGSINRMEKGTASLRITSKRGSSLIERLKRWAPELTVVEPGMTGAPAHAGGFAEKKKGNPNCKALVEGSHRIIHQQNGSIPGQVGMDRMHIPGDYDGRKAEATQIAAIEEAVQELAGTLHSPVIRFQEALAAISQARTIINEDRKHEIEGWHEAGLIAEEVVVDPDSGLALPLSTIRDTWTPQRRQLLDLMIQQDPTLLRSRKYSRAEAFAARREEADIATLPKEALWDLLLDDWGKVRPVIGGEFSFRCSDLGPGTHRYLGTYQDLAGFTHTLSERRDYMTFVNPFAPEVLYVGDANTRALLGYCPIHRKADRTDVDDINREVGKAERRYKDAVADLSKREGLKRIPGLEHNTNALRNAGAGARDRRLLEEIQKAGHRPEDVGLDPQSFLDDPEDEAIETISTENPFDPSQLL